MGEGGDDLAVSSCQSLSVEHNFFSFWQSVCVGYVLDTDMLQHAHGTCSMRERSV